MQSWKPDRLLKAILIWTMITAITIWLPLIRGLMDGSSYQFRGDTFGVDVSLAWAGPLLFGCFALLSVIWVARDLRRGHTRMIMPLQIANRILLAVMLSILPVQFILLRFGEPRGAADKIGVLLTMLQWVGLNIALATSGSKMA